MKLTKAKLRQIIKEELGTLRELDLGPDGGTVAPDGTVLPSQKTNTSGALEDGGTVAGPGGFKGDQAGAKDIQKKAAALDKVEKLLTNLIKQIRSL